MMQLLLDDAWRTSPGPTFNVLYIQNIRDVISIAGIASVDIPVINFHFNETINSARLVIKPEFGLENFELIII